MRHYTSRRWFNLSSPLRKVPGTCIYWRLWSLFNRHTSDGQHWWGFGILQIDNRHLFGVMWSGVSILFIGRIP